MESFEQFRQELRDGLTHLHDPDYRPSRLLCAVVGCEPLNSAGRVQSEILRVIEGLEPPPGTPPTARTRRDFDVLYHRFVLKLTQEETAERLHMSVRNMRRAQRTATHALARLLWEHSLARRAAFQDRGWEEEAAHLPETPVADAGQLDFRAQVRQDLASLQMGAPGVVADVGDTIDHAVELESVLASRYGVSLVVGQVEPHLVAAIHPAALRQILIMAIAQLARCTSPGPIAVHAAPEGGLVRITLAGPASQQDALPDCDLIREILASQGGSIEAGVTGGRVICSVWVPIAGEVTVLVVDDNLDQVHFYRRCATGTRYRILYAPQGQRTAEAIAALAPDIVVLDIILPDADGWDLLAYLREHPDTCSLPVVICSIVREEDLALTLGAALYLPKPVQRREFIRALDWVSEGAPRTRASTAAAC